MKRWGIRTRVLVLALAPALTIALLLGVYFAQVRFTDSERALNERGLAIARQLAPAAEYGVFSGNREVLNGLVAAVAREADVMTVAIRDREGNVLAHSGTDAAVLDHGDAAQPPRQTLDDAAQVLVSSAPVLHSSVALEEFYQAGLADDQRATKVLGRVYVSLSRARLIDQRRRLLFDTLMITLSIIAVGAMLSLRLGRDVTRPITRLTAAVQRLAGGDLHARVTLDSAGVVRELEHGVNTMAAALESARADLEQRIAAATQELTTKRAEAEQANQAKSRFLAAASHDLRQPMHALSLYVAALRDAPLDADTRRLAGQIMKSVSMLQDLLDALLDISKLDAGVVQPCVTDVTLQSLLDKMEMGQAPAARAKGVEFRIVHSRVCVRSDPLLLERILLNLTSNAVRYTRRGKILLGCRRRGDSVRIEVWDTGVGIAPDQQRFIFEEFSRVSAAAPGEEKGLGLGLTIVERLAGLLQHAIEVRSWPGRGSVFSVTVARVAGETVKNDASPVMRAGATLKGKRVVVVDDDAAALKATQTLLQSWGCRVLAAACGDEARALCSTTPRRRPQVVICDYRLAEAETGLQVIQQLQTAYPNAMQYILITADASAEVARAAQEQGVPLLHKPVRPAKLRALLEHSIRAHGKRPAN